MNASVKYTSIHPVRKVEIHYEEESYLFGLIKGWREVKRDSIDEAIYIRMDRVPEDVLINGIKYVAVSEQSESSANPSEGKNL